MVMLENALPPPQHQSGRAEAAALAISI